MTAMLTALAGANVIYGLGMIESGMTFDFGQLVMDNEFARMIRFMVGGIPVNDNTLAVDVTRDVGQFNDFLSHPHTFEHMRTQSHPTLLHRQTRVEWDDAGSKSLQETALEEARRILETHEPIPLSASIQSDIQNLVTEAEEEMGVSKNSKEV